MTSVYRSALRYLVAVYGSATPESLAAFGTCDRSRALAYLTECAKRGVVERRADQWIPAASYVDWVEQETVCHAKRAKPQAPTRRKDGRVLRELRGELSVRGCAKACGVSHVYWMRVEAGEPVQRRTLWAMMRAIKSLRGGSVSAQ